MKSAASDGPLAINNCGQIAGTMVNPNGRMRAFLWDPQTGLTQLGRTDHFVVMNLNNEGCIMGVVVSAGGVEKRAVLLEPIASKWKR